MVGDWVGAGISEKMDVVCPKCVAHNKVLWFPPKVISYRKPATTGGSENAYNKRAERVEGNCKECGYKFKPDDV